MFNHCLLQPAMQREVLTVEMGLWKAGIQIQRTAQLMLCGLPVPGKKGSVAQRGVSFGIGIVLLDGFVRCVVCLLNRFL